AAARLQDRTARKEALAAIENDVKALKKDLLQPEVIQKIFQGKGDIDKTIGKAIGDVLISLLLPASGKIGDAHDRAEQIQRNLRVAFARAAYHRDHGRYPAKLEALAPKYLPAVPGDLFSGEPLVYRQEVKGYLLYSVGANGKDEEGRWFDDVPP